MKETPPLEKAKQRPAAAGILQPPAGRTARKSAAGSGHSKAGTGGDAARYAAIATVPLVLVFGNSMLVPVLPDLKKALDVSQLQTSLVITLFSVTAGIAIPVVGYLSDRLGRKPVILAALAVYGAAGLLAGLAAAWKSYPLLIAARALQGLGASGTAPVAMALAGDLFTGAARSRALGIVEASNGIGKALSPIVGSLLALIVWQAPFFAFPAFCLASFLCVAVWIREPARSAPPPPPPAYLKDVGNVFREKGRWLAPSFAAGALALFILFGVLFYLSDVLEKKPYNIDGAVKGLVLAVPLAGMVTASWLTGRAIKKDGARMRRLTLAGLAFMAAALGLAVFVPKNMVLLVGLLTASGVGTGLVLPCLNTLIAGSVGRDKRGMITSLYGSLRFLGVAFGPPLFGWLADISARAPFMAVSALALVALLLVAFTVKPPETTG
jgi:ACDE family multidrug resistance protein